MHHEHGINMKPYTDFNGGYLRFYCGFCKKDKNIDVTMKIIGVWIDGRGRLILNGRCPACGYWDVRKIGIDMSTIVWISPKQKFTLYDDLTKTSVPTKKRPNKSLKKRGHSRISSTLRFEILERDNFTCQYCGHKDITKRTLEVDHIHPVSKGGATTKDNLITACNRCNRGKGAKVLKKQPKPRR